VLLPFRGLFFADDTEIGGEGAELRFLVVFAMGFCLSANVQQSLVWKKILDKSRNFHTGGLQAKDDRFRHVAHATIVFFLASMACAVLTWKNGLATLISFVGRFKPSKATHFDLVQLRPSCTGSSS
jgi:hypothetical protein